jgi:hypothetical protein
MPRFSIIVPLKGDERLFDQTLASILRDRPASSEILVIHDGTYQDPHQLGEEITFASTEKKSDLIAMFNHGVSLASGDFLAFIRPGIELSPDWQLTVEAAFHKPDIASVSPLITTPAEPRKIVTAGVEAGIGFQRKMSGARRRATPSKLARVSPLGPTSWAAFYRRSAIEQIHPVSENLSSVFLDQEIAMSLRTIGLKTNFSSETNLEVERSGLITAEQKLPHGQSAQRTYRRQAITGGSILRTASLIAWDLLNALLKPWRLQQAGGRISAIWHRREDRKYHAHLTKLVSENQLPLPLELSGHTLRDRALDLSPTRRAA